MSQTKVTDNLRDTTAVDATKITTGTIPEARITSLDATKLTGTINNARISLDEAEIPNLGTAKVTSGTFADARISESSVTQHVTGYNDATIKADILKLAISQAVDGNRVAFNLTDSFIDGFEDDTGITTETNVDRNTDGEYVDTSVLGSNTYMADGTISDRIYVVGSISSGFSDGDLTKSEFYSPHTSGNQSCFWTSPTTGYVRGFYIDYLASYRWTGIKLAKSSVYGDVRTFRLEYSDNASDWTVVNQTGTTASAFSGCSSGYTDIISTFASDGVMDMGAMPDNKTGGGILAFGTPFNARYLKMAIGTWASNSNSNVGWRAFIPRYQPLTVSATGTLISDPQTASSSRTSVSGVIVYEDASGTATLGTDLKIYFTANNGSNWTEAASYATAVTYSGTKKLVTLGATTVTAGTQIAIKAEWANQSSGSKETRLHGWAVNY